MSPNSWIGRDNTWWRKQLASANEIKPHSYESELSSLLIEKAYNHAQATGDPVGLNIAAVFDIIVAAEYYRSMTHSGWSYCPRHKPLLIYPYVNICPRCILEGDYNYCPGNKPPSGTLGTGTSRLLMVFLSELFKRNGKSIRIYKGSEPIDLVIIDEKQKVIMFAEIKAAPLVPIPLGVESEKLTELVDGEVTELKHGPTSNTKLDGVSFSLLIPVKDSGKWKIQNFEIGPWNSKPEWAYYCMSKYFSNNGDFFDSYFEFWHAAYETYRNKDRANSLYWWTNASGQPSPIPEGWPRRRTGSGYESVSDAKTSVGMDRTDDIKKGIYQVLKIASEGKPGKTEYTVKVALISNIDAARHFDEYLHNLQDVVWTLDTSKKAKIIGDLPDDIPIYNLFDGIISFTKNVFRDEWIEGTFSL